MLSALSHEAQVQRDETAYGSTSKSSSRIHLISIHHHHDLIHFMDGMP